jgi:pimeloyl-ACP methyl ester carboxylesterase
MSPWVWVLIVAVVASLGLWLVSHVIEALRRRPAEPPVLRWAPDIPIGHVDVGGARLRFIKTGAGSTLVLLHTLRTQLDLFEKMIPELAGRFTVYVPDYPGHGYSDIPPARYDAAFFADAIEGFVRALDLREVTLAGVSIGGVIPLMIAARHNPRIVRVVAINPYDYARGRGMMRSSLLGRITTYASLVPMVGETFMRLRSFPFISAVLRGGVADARSISPAFMREMYLVGNRQRHYQAFISLLRNAESFERAREDYAAIDVPVLLIWGDRDWSRPSERERTRSLVPRAAAQTITGGGHFLPLDRPRELAQLLIGFASK